MTAKTSERTSVLVNRARARAIRRGTTLEAEVEAWLDSYVTDAERSSRSSGRADPDASWFADISADSRSSATTQVHVSRSPEAARRVPPVKRDAGDSRSVAYRRLMALMRNAPE